MAVRRTTVTLRPGAWEVVERETLPGESVSSAVCRLIEIAGFQLGQGKAPKKRKRAKAASVT